MLRKNAGRGEGFVPYEIPFAIYFYPRHSNTNANLDTFTKNLEIKRQNS